MTHCGSRRCRVWTVRVLTVWKGLGRHRVRQNIADLVYFAVSCRHRQTRSSISSRNIACHISEVLTSQRRSYVYCQKIDVVDNPNVVWRPCQDEPPWISAWTLYFHCHWPTSLLLKRWVYLHSNLCSGLQSPKMHLFCNRMRFGRSRSSKSII